MLLHGLPVMKAQYLVVISVCIIRVNENSRSQRAEEFDFLVPDAPGGGPLLEILTETRTPALQGISL